MKQIPADLNQKKYQNKTIEDHFFLTGIIFSVVLLAVTLTGFLFPGLWQFLNLPACLFHRFSGYYCPGCGGTRALRALLHGHILTAVCFHPVVPYAAAVYLYFMITQTAERISGGKLRIGMRYHNYLVWIAVGLIMGNFILKNMLHHFYGFTF